MKASVEDRPIVGIEGLLRLVKVIEKLEASSAPTNEELHSCHPKLSPPGHKQSPTPAVAPASASQSKALNLATQPDARKSVEIPAQRGTES